MMTSEHLEHFLEDSPHRDVKLNEVFNKLSDILQQQTPIKQKMSCDVIDSILPDRNTVPISSGSTRPSSDECLGDDGSACQSLTRRLEEELRAAKTAQLSCGEVLLPADLLPRIARDVIRMAENEPCGLRGCTLFINFGTEEECRRIGTIKCDPNTVSTFELFLTLTQDAKSTWHSILPQFIKNLTKGGTIMISPAFELEKKKLYRSYLD
ncbi:protein charybde isoform X1 [Nilaparvata lugens]|uniref:protein charybde isoform X1 n=2 Tax=Nilaparvata lugens TaxID=108931 RepID=UPI000B9817D8|nr:protein charybde isoform X1 [Nilaparvata lugens]XP_039292441.1 protein charybde isoform X1 [Nilaparvata lugens]